MAVKKKNGRSPAIVTPDRAPAAEEFTKPIVPEDSEGIQRFSKTRQAASSSDAWAQKYLKDNPKTQVTRRS